MRSGSVDDTLASAENDEADDNNAVSERETTDARPNVASSSEPNGKNDRPLEFGDSDLNKAGTPVAKKTGITGK